MRLQGENIVLRTWVRRDIDESASWPGGAGFRKMDSAARDEYFGVMNKRAGFHHLAAEDKRGEVIGLVTVGDIHESERVAYNMTSRFGKDAASGGLVGETFRLLLNWCFGELGLVKVCAVVPATEGRMIENYVACGFEKAWDFWQPEGEDGPGAGKQPRLDAALTYVTEEQRKTYVKHVVMEITGK